MKIALAAQKFCPGVSNYQSGHPRSTPVKLDTHRSSNFLRIRNLPPPIFNFFAVLQGLFQLTAFKPEAQSMNTRYTIELRLACFVTVEIILLAGIDRSKVGF
jgi:hypothetical protein